MPMTKAAVKAMDAIQEYMKGVTPTIPITGFMVAGASKRGWTTWTTGAVDSRVFAIAPLVMPILNMIPNMGEEFRNYGNWSFAIDDYVNAGVMKQFWSPQMQQLADIVDPYSYVDRLTMPKLVIAATGDEFFLPDSPKWFWDSMQGESHLFMVPNCEHSLFGHELPLGRALETFFYLVAHDIPRPTYTWNITTLANGTAVIDVYTDPKNPPFEIIKWTATTFADTYRRDFRLVTCDEIICFQPVLWFEEDVVDLGNGHYQATQDPPSEGWTGFFVEVDYNFGNAPGPLGLLTTSTIVKVVPDTYPYPNCGPPTCDNPPSPSTVQKN
eukprot:TRINITY_DN6130_c0_g1_i1.p1 TRINITY_DN6130_c0_g1~~TRINITY_DN6130_c0_g1_i1.p1  ORF type:complete len:326 (-),score=58.91 TRINITY_DN6130_c0_g1_i1:59-1036(-)